METVIYVLGILGAIGLTAVGVLFSYHRKKAAILASCATLVIFVLAVYLYWQQQTVPKLEQPTFREKVEEVVTFSLGERGMSSSYSLSDLEKKPREPFELRGYKPFRMYVENGKLYVDVSVYGGANLPPVEIEHNKFTRRMSSQWDINSNTKALEVVNEDHFPVFQLFYKTPSHIVVNGVFPFPGGLFLANESGVEMISTAMLPRKFSLKRIFKYPSWKYPGQYDE